MDGRARLVVRALYPRCEFSYEVLAADGNQAIAAAADQIFNSASVGHHGNAHRSWEFHAVRKASQSPSLTAQFASRDAVHLPK
jgi:hypothetical protein